MTRSCFTVIMVSDMGGSSYLFGDCYFLALRALNSVVFAFGAFGGEVFTFYVFTDFSSILYRWSLRGPPFWIARKRGKSNQRAPKPPFGIWLFIRGLRRGDVLASYEFAVMQLTRFRPTRWRAPHCFHRVQLYCKCRLYGTAYDFPWHPQHAEARG